MDRGGARADRIEDRLIRAAHAIRRGRWLAVLSDASVAFDGAEGRRLLVVHEGQIAKRAWLAEGVLPPCPPGALRSTAERRGALDAHTHDRLRILTTELRRLHGDGDDPAVRTGPAALVRGEALGRLLHWV